MTESSPALARVQALLDVHREDEAVDALRQLLATEPTDARAWRMLAHGLDRRGEHRAALDAATRSLALDPEDEWGHRLASRALGSLRRWGPAARAAQESVRLAPGNWLGQAHLAHALVDHALYAPKIWSNGPLVRGARQAADRAVELAPDQPDALYCRARLAQRLGKPKEAQAGYRRVLALDPQHVGALTGLGELRPSLSGAANHFGAALQVDPRSTPALANLEQVVIRLLLGYWLLGLLLAFCDVMAGLTVGSPPWPPIGWLRAVLVVVCLAAAVLPVLLLARRLDPPLRRYLLQLPRLDRWFGVWTGVMAAIHLTLIVLPALPTTGRVLAIQAWATLTVGFFVLLLVGVVQRGRRPRPPS